MTTVTTRRRCRRCARRSNMHPMHVAMCILSCVWHVQALREAHEWMSKARVQGKETKVASLQSRINHVEAFVGARKMIKSDPEATVKL